jgi:hypothetical protein
MKIIALLDVTPFDGTDPILCLRIQSDTHIFDLPIDTNQLDIILSNMPGEPTASAPPSAPQSAVADEDSEDDAPIYAPSPIKRPPNNSQFKMGYSPDYEDDDL